MSRHAYLSPSGAPRWANCTASPKFIESLKLKSEPPSAHAEEGTRAHLVLANALGMDNPYKVNYEDDDQKKYMPVAFDYVEILKDLYPEAKLYREISVDPVLYVRTSHCSGTADIVVPVDFGPLFVSDFKWGVGVVVEAYENFQLILYALGVLAEFPDYVFTEVVISIVQPRAYHPAGPIREWRISVEELMEWGKFLGARAREALGPNSHFRPGIDTCRFCPASGVCRALAEFNLGVARRVFTNVIDFEVEYKDENQLTNAEIAYILDVRPLMKKWLQQVESHALRYVQDGHRIPRWGLKSKQARRRWDCKPTELKMYFDEEVLYENTLRSPAQVEKLAGRGSVRSFVTRTSSGDALTPITDEPVETEATNVFDEVEEDAESEI